MPGICPKPDDGLDPLGVDPVSGALRRILRGSFASCPRTGGHLLRRIRKSPFDFWTLLQPPKALPEPVFWLSRCWLTPRP